MRVFLLAVLLAGCGVDAIPPVRDPDVRIVPEPFKCFQGPLTVTASATDGNTISPARVVLWKSQDVEFRVFHPDGGAAGYGYARSYCVNGPPD